MDAFGSEDWANLTSTGNPRAGTDPDPNDTTPPPLPDRHSDGSTVGASETTGTSGSAPAISFASVSSAALPSADHAVALVTSLFEAGEAKGSETSGIRFDVFEPTIVATAASAPAGKAYFEAGHVNNFCACGCGVDGAGGYGGGESPIGASGAGLTQLLAQTFSGGAYHFSGVRNVDAVLIGSRWTETTLTYSFPTEGSFYTGTDPFGYASGHIDFNAAQQTAVRYALGLVSNYTNLNFAEVTETASVHARLRFSQTSDTDLGSAQGMFPSQRADAGDVWFGTASGQPFYLTPAVGNWGMATQMHEIGHVLGLKHGHQDYTNLDLNEYLNPGSPTPRFGSRAINPRADGQPWSLMTYTGVGFSANGEAQTYMQYDIAALQYMYGADFTTQSGNTVYSWSSTTGEMSINGVGQGAPQGNKIFMTVWDGNGVDTYDLANYTTKLNVDLEPGAFSIFDTAQLASQSQGRGNVANALLFNGDVRSLIENVKGGSNDDFIQGNAANNTLAGRGGNDLLNGRGGDDLLGGGAGDDGLYGDFIFFRAPAFNGTGTYTKPAGVNDDTIGSPLGVNPVFGRRTDPNITSSSTNPTASIQVLGDGTFDYYSFTVHQAGTITLDIDFGAGDVTAFDSMLHLYDASGTAITYSDDASSDPGSTSSLDSFLTYNVTVPGVYIVRVSAYGAGGLNGGVVVPNTAGYTLQITLPNPVSVLGGPRGNDQLLGNAGLDTLHGGAGFDVLDGGADFDIALLAGLRGGGHDLFSYGGVVYALDRRDRSFDTITNVEQFGDGGQAMLSGDVDGFNPLAYGASHNDLAQIFGNNASALFNHWLHHGFNEGRAALDYDAAQYLANYADLRNVFGTDGAAATLHFLQHGVHERRMADDPLDYIASFDDLIGAFGGRSLAGLQAAGLQHYAQAGFTEGRRTFVDFDASLYLANNADLAGVFGSDLDAATAHYINFGHAERRMADDPLTYIASFTDLINTFGDLSMPDMIAAARQHYATTGANEGRRNGIDFNVDNYLANYQGLRFAFADASGGYDEQAATYHYIRYGFDEGRTDTLLV